jgi:hypothetical protein
MSRRRLPVEERRIEMAATTLEVLSHHLHSFGDIAGRVPAKRVG